MKIIGITGWSGAGKTTLLASLIPELRRRGLRVSTIKHAHHAFDIDTPGKDSHTHREAGAEEVLVSSGRRHALIRELRGEAEWTLPQLIARLTPVDLVIVEGFKSDVHPKIEVFRENVGKPPLFPGDVTIVAVAAEVALETDGRPVMTLGDTPAIADAVAHFARPTADVFGGRAAWRS